MVFPPRSTPSSTLRGVTSSHTKENVLHLSWPLFTMVEHLHATSYWWSEAKPSKKNLCSENNLRFLYSISWIGLLQASSGLRWDCRNPACTSPSASHSHGKGRDLAPRACRRSRVKKAPCPEPVTGPAQTLRAAIFLHLPPNQGCIYTIQADQVFRKLSVVLDYKVEETFFLNTMLNPLITCYCDHLRVSALDTLPNINLCYSSGTYFTGEPMPIHSLYSFLRVYIEGRWKKLDHAKKSCLTRQEPLPEGCI